MTSIIIENRYDYKIVQWHKLIILIFINCSQLFTFILTVTFLFTVHLNVDNLIIIFIQH